MVCHRVRSSAFNWILALIASAQTAKSPCIRSTFAPHCGRKGPTGFSKRAPTEKNAENPFWACSPASNHFIYSGSRMVRLDQHEHAGAGAVRRCVISRLRLPSTTMSHAIRFLSRPSITLISVT